MRASNYCEWKGEGAANQPHFIDDAEGELLMFVGVWESWRETKGLYMQTSVIEQPTSEQLADFDSFKAVLAILLSSAIGSSHLGHLSIVVGRVVDDVAVLDRIDRDDPHAYRLVLRALQMTGQRELRVDVV